LLARRESKQQANIDGPVVDIRWAGTAVALAVLLLGTLVYLLDRPPEAAPFFQAFNITQKTPSIFGVLGQSLPTFAHTFAFGLITAIWLQTVKQSAGLACLAWFVIDAGLELGQHTVIAARIASLIPASFERLPVLQHARAYFVNGSFDTRDLISIALGAITAYCIANWVIRKSNNEQ
jgi:hypothetical protein